MCALDLLTLVLRIALWLLPIYILRRGGHGFKRTCSSRGPAEAVILAEALWEKAATVGRR